MQTGQQHAIAFDVAIATVRRAETYIDALLATLRSDLPIRLIAGGDDTTYLEKHKRSPSIELIGVPAEEWDHFKASPVHLRATWNYWRSLIFGSRSLSRHGLLVFEDECYHGDRMGASTARDTTPDRR